MTYSEEFIKWLHDEGKDSKTIQAYETVIRQFTNWLIETEGKETIAEIKPIEIKEFLGYLKHSLNRKQTTINKAIAGLKTYFSFLAEKNYISDNPMTRIKIQKIPATNQFKDTNKWLTIEEQERYISYVELEKNEFKRLRNVAIINL
ncbi:MAG: phage integrase N-terminal SAM-like domain-containing protein, partial [Desulfitobacteriaceae bacterium]|nr:phage integrase N-terminal SAM-like domain-containing protein [Desulfitobacteriaceae bacterium]